MKELFVLIAAYLLGAIPFAYIITKQTMGIDIRSVGSGNVGFTNALRTLKKGPALAVLAGDIGKGIAAVLLAKAFGGPALATLAGLAVVIGHNYPVFLGFKGGKGAATGFGALLALLPLIALITVAIWLVTVAVSRYVSLGTILAATLLPFICLLFRVDWAYFIFALIGSVMVIYRHQANIGRLRSGTESKIGKKIK